MEAPASGEAMRFSLLMRAHYPPGCDLGRRVEELFEQVRLAERLAFHAIFKGSHFSAGPARDVPQLPFLVRAAAETSRIGIGAGIVLLPLLNPLQVAEEFAALDVLSKGRLIFGVGLGYRDVEFKAFGVPPAEGVSRLEENLEAVLRLWTEEEVTFRGRGFTLDGASCPMKPFQKPRPPVWMGANGDAGVRRAARLADTWFINPHARLDTLGRQCDLYRRALAELGKPWPGDLPIMREVYVARSHEAARAAARPLLEAKYRAYQAWGQARAMPKEDSDLGQEFDALAEDRFFIGTPDDVAAQIVDAARMLGVNHFVLGQKPGAAHGAAVEEMHLIAEEVIPRARKALG